MLREPQAHRILTIMHITHGVPATTRAGTSDSYIGDKEHCMGDRGAVCLTHPDQTMMVLDQVRLTAHGSRGRFGYSLPAGQA